MFPNNDNIVNPMEILFNLKKELINPIEIKNKDKYIPHLCKRHKEHGMTF